MYTLTWYILPPSFEFYTITRWLITKYESTSFQSVINPSSKEISIPYVLDVEWGKNNYYI